MHPLLKLRTELDCTQEQMAERLGVSRQRWSALETGKPCGYFAAVAIVDTWKREAESLGITVEKLVRYGR